MTERTAPGTDSIRIPDTADQAFDEQVVSARPEHGARDTRVIWLLLGATFVVFLNETIMSVAIPHLVVDLDITLSAAQWLTTAFMLTMAVVIPITGFLLQRFPTRPIFGTAMTLFSAGTLLAALAPGFEVLLGARIVQATGTAIMMPLLMTSLMTLVAPSDRGRFMGRVSIVMSVAPAIGPAMSGLILNYFGWRYMFWFVLPFAVTMLVIGLRRVRNIGETRVFPIDAVSVVISAIGFGGLVYGLSLVGGVVSGRSPGDATAMWISLAAGALGITAFIVRQVLLQRSDRALLDLRTFRTRNFAVSIALMAVMMAALFGTIILLPIYLQDVAGLEPLATGLLVLPGGLVMGLLGPTVGRLYDRVGPTPLLVPGSIVVSAVLWSLTLVTESTPPWMILIAHVALSTALAFMFTPLFTSALGSVEPHLYSHASATVGTLQQVAGAAGTALFITVMTATAASAQAAGTAEIAAQAAGVRNAFLVGAILSLFAIVGSTLVRRPADMAKGAAEGVPAH
ncbi:DHA2 family lincomycin resistance protein-like MFS transporter [Agromyces flavus]|uniref:DHA2 family lincomycin resistance protein-like MFS transporter n=1 Tax=Agromyces flavus TaxID=589382 RepID=A0A1H1NBI0_9MICO|nr:DHA2 family lincomycin resistance protein-like MFS transporter [Agromyces flavus]GGI48603.1 MFS transporter [Agromyces flavus]SDR96302.1 MFS transporter, DHA2 family, lincomycin resistance protein [Agromyces flavus]